MKAGMKRETLTARIGAAFAAALLSIVVAAAPAVAEEKAGPGDLDFFLGEWDIVSINALPDGTYAESRARSHAYRFLDGAAIMDEWRSLNGAGDIVFRGASFRTWLPATGQWRIVWMMAHVDGATIIDGKMVDGEFHMTGKGRDPGGEFLESARYHHISEDGFIFTMDRSYDGGETWITPFNEFKATRITDDAK